ncbi:hypothetical protein GCM10022631_18800 [Deinococcus rubellus]|uniref:Uncharacterized protein n=1 Tax=Deinococcus rubellus TaxID=1889240 RepID=A0ABY5YG26_9DEIO|nr:hypothetical protein [Deinococcus rubellus]UWX63676.1 hypothetical protein N0D28_13205 [Deinococcus rubellus]
MLSSDEKQQILAEERALEQAEQEARQCSAHVRARETYRAEVRAAQRARPWRWRWVLGGGLLWTAAALAFLVMRQPPMPDDLSGGIASSALIERCERALLSQLGQLAAQFPDTQEAARQITSSTDGKRWDGWVVSSSNFSGRADFSCAYSPPTDSIQAQLIQ